MKLEEFVFDVPLYRKITAQNGYLDIFEQLKEKSYNTTVEGYNPIHKKESTFFLAKGLGNFIQFDNDNDIYRYFFEKDFVMEIGVKTITFRCQRYRDEITIAVFHNPEESIIMKVGQYPSVADIHIGQVKQYDKVLEKPILREFTKAIGLAANGVGIGSFVYLRRIFENLVFQAFDEAKKDGAAIDHFESLRMEEKIKVLKGYLPSFIVENNSVYGILSKGIHELTEEDCLAYFDCMRQSIELILDERLVQLEKKKKIDEVKKTLNTITSQIKK